MSACSMQAVQEKHAIAPPVTGTIILEAGVVQFFTAQLDHEREVAKALMRQAERLSLQAVGEVDAHRLRLDPGYYHLHAAMALTAWHNPATFNDHLNEATRLTNPSFRRHHLHDV